MMDQQSSEPTTQSTVAYDSDGSVVMKQEPQNDFSQMDIMDVCGLNENVLNIATIPDNKTAICKIGDVYSIKQEPHDKWCELYGTSHHPAVKRENDLDVCDYNQDTKLFKRDISLKMESFQTANTSSQSIDVSCAIDCKAAQQQPPCHLESTDQIKTEGM